MARVQEKAPLTRTEPFFDIAYWRKLAPHFPIGEKIDSSAFALRKAHLKQIDEKFLREGYVHLAQPGLTSPFGKIADLFTKIVSLGLPPVFSFVYDEMWRLNTQLRALVGILLHKEYAMLPDFWAWCVLPGQSGWKPHRDKPSGCLFPDNRPKSLTVWLPITQAHPLNGCMYILPADRDCEYSVENSPRGAGTLPEIRALPAEAGDVLAWTQHVFHWGGHSADVHDLPPRMSVAFEYQRSDVPPFNVPLLDPSVYPTFEERLALISKQILQYRHMYTYPDALVDLAEKIGKKHGLPKAFQ